MENVTPEKKQPIIKGLAVAGLMAIIILSAWLAIQIVKVLPTAIDSLASIANSVYNHNPLQTKNIQVAADKTLLRTNEAITLSWPLQKNPGTYTFSYTCQDNISLSLTTSDKNVPLLTCDKDYELGSTTAVSLSAKSDATSMVDVNYKIAFFRTNDPVPSASHNGVLTIANPNLDSTVMEITPPTQVKETEVEIINQPEVVVASTSNSLASSTIISEVKEGVPDVSEPKVVKPVVATTTPVKAPVKITTPKPNPKPTATTPSYIYKIPVSDPNGTIDLVVNYLGIGTKNEPSTISTIGLIREDRAGILKFSVRNIGTKTSNTWTFKATLPGSVNYESTTQTALKPNERAVISIEFPAIDKPGVTKAKVEVDTTTDKNKNNNSFSTDIIVIK